MFQPYELRVWAFSGASIFELDISLPQGTVRARVACIFGGRSPSYSGDKCNRGNVPAEIIMETWDSCSIIEDSPLGVSVIAMGQTATNNQVGNLKVYDLKKLNKGEKLTIEIMIVQIWSSLQWKNYSKLKNQLLRNIHFKVGHCDNIFGTNFATCEKTFTVKSSFTQTWMTQHGFDLSVTIGTSFEADAFFASVTSSFQLSLGYSFTSSYTKSKTEEVSESFKAGGNVPAGAKMEVRFFKSDIQLV